MAGKPDTNLVGMLRQRTVEEDLKQYLKSVIGGYTKKSVTEYMNLLHEQQLKYGETFNRNMQAILEEKESLKKENERLLLRSMRVESDYQALAESLKINNLEDPETPQNVKNMLTGLEAENRDLKNAGRQLETRIETLERKLSETHTELEKSQQEERSRSELLALEKKETNKQRELVSQYTRSIEEFQQEIQHLNTVLSEGALTKLTIKISELMANAALKEEIIDRYKNELLQKSDEIAMLAEENETLRRSIEQIKSTLISLTVQNEKLMSANTALSSSLESENKRIIQLLYEKSEQTVEKLIAARRLDELNMKLSLMQMLPENTEDVPAAPEIVESMPAS